LPPWKTGSQQNYIVLTAAKNVFMMEVTMITELLVREALKEVYDPELSLSVQELGLIYEVNCKDTHVHIKHTLTSMFCPFAEEICRGIYDTTKALDGVETVNRELVYDPPYSMEMVPEETRMIMGWY
jgi:metal-sulfur cluster biosynthetic enzyme